MRKNIIEYLRLLSSSEQQLEYQRNVPFVNITVELVCMWFDDNYHPEEKYFSSAFTKKELQAMSEFNRVFDEIATSDLCDMEVPGIELFIKTPQWTRLSQAAFITLQVLDPSQSGR